MADKLAATERLFRACLASDVPFIQKSGEYISDGGGKRMRPALLLLCARMLERDGEEEVTYAAVVELIHTATLIHDDIIDHAALRRGQQTINELWGNNLTVLLGDWLYTTAMRMALSHGNLEAIRPALRRDPADDRGRAAGPAAPGRDRSYGRRVLRDHRPQDRAAVRRGLFPAGLIAPARPEAVEPLARYGRALGTCFQLVDDLLDFTATPDDSANRCSPTSRRASSPCPCILLLPRIAPPERAAGSRRCSPDGAFRRSRREEILELVAREGTLEEVEEMARLRRGGARGAEPFPTAPPARRSSSRQTSC